MVEKEKIKKLVKEVVDKNKLQNCFIPIIEEFFFRVADQLNWNDEELNNAIRRYKKVKDIKFVNMNGIKILKKDKKITSKISINMNTKRTDICFDVYDLKNILEFDIEKIEGFINRAMHEQGHLIQVQEKKNKVYAGFEEIKISTKNTFLVRDKIIDEFAEVINATRLQNGKIESDKYSGYETIQTAGKIILNSFGISELELANLQFEPNAREQYEEFIANKLGSIPSEIYRNSFGKILDAIYNFSKDENQRDNFILQIDSLQVLSKDLFEKRFYDIIMNSDNTMKNFARLCINQGEKEKALKRLFYEFNIKESELQIKTNRNPYSMLAEQGYDLKELKKFYDIESEERRKIQEQKDKQCKKNYDNEELIERLYQSFFKYPIRKVPLKDRLGVILSKIHGMKKRKALKQAKLLPEPNITNYDSHTEFMNRISDLEEYKEKDIIQHENWITEVEEERDNSDESSREN